MKRFLMLIPVLLLATWVLVQSGIPAASAETAVRMEVETGWNGEWKGKFVPVTVKLTNEGNAEIKGELTVHLPSNWQDVLPSGIPYEEVVLPAKSSQTWMLAIPGAWIERHVNIVLNVGRSQVASVPLDGRELSGTDVTVGMVGVDAKTAALWEKRLNESKERPDVMVHVYTLAGNRLPAQGVALDGLDALVLARTDGFSHEQVQAIRQWVADGGKLVVTGGEQANETAQGLEDLLPVRLTGQVKKVDNWSGLAPWGTPPSGAARVAVGKRADGGRILAKSGDTVLLALKNTGWGSVYFTAWAWEDPVLTAWPGSAVLWDKELALAKMLRERDVSPVADVQPYFGWWGLEETIRKFSSLRMPDVKALAALFALYVLVVGPLFYRLFARRKKWEWNWGTIPLISLLFASGLFIYGERLRGNEVMLHQLGYVQSDAHGVDLIRGMGAILSGRDENYRVHVKDAFSWPYDVPGGFSSYHLPVQVSFRPEPLLEYRDMPQWTIRRFYLENVKETGALEGRLQAGDKEWKVEVTNRTPWTLHYVQLLMRDRVEALGTLKPGEHRSLTLPPQDNPAPLSLPDRIYTGEDRQISMWDQVRATRHFLSPNGFMVIGWADVPVADVQVEGKQVKETGMVMVGEAIEPVADESGRVVFPFGSVMPNLIESTAPVVLFPENGALEMESNGSVTLEYAIGSGNVSAVERVKVESYGKDVQVYDWRNRTWKPLPGPSLDDPAPYLSPDQRLRLRINLSTRTDLELPLIQVEGRML